MFYSAKKNQWYDGSLRSEYEAGIGWPEDAKEYPVGVFHETVLYRPIDKILAPDADGNPVLIDRPDPTTEELAAQARAVRDAKLDETGWMIERHHEQLAANIATTLTEEQYVALLGYRQALRDVPAQPSFPQEIIWPVKP